MQSDASWKELNLGDVIELKRGYDLPKGKRSVGVIPIVSSSGISDFHSEAMVKGPGVVTGRYGTIGEVFYIDSDFWPLNTTLYVRDFKGSDPRFISYFLRTLDFQAYSDKGAVPGVNRNHLHTAKVRIPALPVQKAIARVLDTLDSKIALNRRINQTLEAMAQAIFKSWFVDFDPVKAKVAAIEQGEDPLRAAMCAIAGKSNAEIDQMPREHYDQLAATAALFPEVMEESELGKIPMGWIVSKVETLLSRLSAKTRYTKEQVLEYGQTPVFEQGASILLGYHNGGSYYQASSENPMFIFGDHTCVTRLSCQPFDISQNVIPLQGKNRATTWVYYAVKEKQKFQEYRRHWMELISKDVVVATADICLDFSKKITNIHLQIEANERQMHSLRELRDTLLPKLLSGELSINPMQEANDD